MKTYLKWLLILVGCVLSGTKLQDLDYSCPKLCTCTEASQVYCDDSGLDHIPAGIPKESQMVNLDKNNITEILSTAFEGMTRLEVLSLSDNNIRTLEPGCFNDLYNLTELYLSNNLIEVLNPHLFRNSIELGRLELSYNKLMFIPDFLPVPSTLNTLTLDHNNLKDFAFPVGFETVELLRVDLSDNPKEKKIKSQDLDNIKESVIELNIRNCNINHIEPGAFYGLGKLHVVDFSYNPGIVKDLSILFRDLSSSVVSLLKLNGVFDVSVLPSSTFKNLNLSGITHLWMDNNKISTLKSYTFKELPSLELLSLQNSSIQNIEVSTFSKLQNLQDLYLSSNLIFSVSTDLPESLVTLDLSNNKALERIEIGVFSRLKKLRVLNLNYCSIKTIELDAFEGLESLDTINFSNNKLDGSELHKNIFCRSMNVNSILLNHNTLGHIPEDAKAFQNLPNLQEVELAGCSIENLPSELFLNSSLNTLLLSRNRLGQAVKRDILGIMFEHLDNLEYLDLSYNSISHIPVMFFSKLHTLRVLDLSRNLISQWDPGVFLNMPSLQELSMDENKILSIRQSNLNQLVQVELWNLSSNPFRCDCKLKPFIVWMAITNVTLAGLETYSCSSPQDMNNTSLLELNPQNFTCSNTGPTVNPLKMEFIIVVASSLVLIIVISVILVVKCKKRLKGYRKSPVTEFEDDSVGILDDSQNHKQPFSISRILCNIFRT